MGIFTEQRHTRGVHSHLPRVRPEAGLIQARDGSLNGTTTYGGSSSCTLGCRTILRLIPGGAFTTVYGFAEPPGGSYPVGRLIQAADGSLYGTTEEGGFRTACAFGCGTVFKITPGGTFTTLHNFAATDGFSPQGGLVQATDGNLYGTTVERG